MILLEEDDAKATTVVITCGKGTTIINPNFLVGALEFVNASALKLEPQTTGTRVTEDSDVPFQQIPGLKVQLHCSTPETLALLHTLILKLACSRGEEFLKTFQQAAEMQMADWVEWLAQEGNEKND